jgi:hypothetical protein
LALPSRLVACRFWGFGSFSLFGSKQPTVTLFRDGAGKVTGRFSAGPYAGRKLDSFSQDQLVSTLRTLDEESASRLEAYLDRRYPGWRGDAQNDANARPPTSGSQTLTEQEAYEILGLEAGAGEQAIREAHRALMKKIHPDQGGTNYLATRVNLAKDLLLQRHGRNS